MRIAVCLSGEPRTFKSTAGALKSFFGGHKVDFFVHAWASNTWFDKNHDKDNHACEIEIVNENSLMDDLCHLYAPKKCKVETKRNNAFAVQSQLYSMMVCNHLKNEYEIEHNFVYDLVVRIRFDLIFDPNTFFVIPENIDQFAIYATRIDYNRGFFPALFDRFIFGTSMSMDKLCSVYKFTKHMENYSEFMHTNFHIIDAEMLLYNFCKLNNITIILHNMHETFVRRSARDFDSVNDFDKIRQIDHDFFKVDK